MQCIPHDISRSIYSPTVEIEGICSLKQVDLNVLLKGGLASYFLQHQKKILSLYSGNPIGNHMKWEDLNAEMLPHAEKANWCSWQRGDRFEQSIKKEIFIFKKKTCLLNFHELFYIH